MSGLGALSKLLKYGRDKHGRIYLPEVPREVFDELKREPFDPNSKYLLSGEELEAPVNKGALWASQWPAHALHYSARDYAVPRGFLSVFEAPKSPAEVFPLMDAAEKNAIFKLYGAGELNNSARALREVPRAARAGGGRLEGVYDWALQPDVNDSMEHTITQYLLLDPAKVQRRKRGGLIQAMGA